ncbi:hypothetical protein PIB30_066531 [Stylosanthes scabra]|uniref:Uncharacterized protein n=1 Tax=Stylosanthes scabra TaxID=79078 RepID=A0ABU6SNQ4_9FABA|nr:hypothetical protein [Stylosanthes scabra]
MAEMMMKRQGKVLLGAMNKGLEFRNLGSVYNLNPKSKIQEEVGPPLKSGPGFESEQIPNPGNFPSSVSNKVLFFCKAPILSSNTSVHELASRFGPALRLSWRSWAESAIFGASRLNPGSTPVHLGELVQWDNKPMVHLVNRSTGLDQSTLVSCRSTAGQRWPKAVNFFFSSGSSQEVKWLYTDFANSDHRKFLGPICGQLRRKY